ncbi:MAG: hypothetical protein JKX85_09970 [Phycisphaeraceae bacterium]|nr:hypothetical protein [Phycisphaeraceae bacterium]
MRMFIITLIASLFLAPAAHGASVHTATLPNGIAYPANELLTHAVYLEGESLGKSNKADTFPKGHRPVTVFRTAAKPNNYWGAVAVYDKSRVATRGSEKRNYPSHHLIWENIKQKLAYGIYEVYVRCMITKGGDMTFTFKKADDVKSLQHAKATKPVIQDKANITWIRIGSVDLAAGDDSFELSVSAQQTPVRIDTVLLVKAPSPEAIPLQFKRLPNANAISDRPGGFIFATETATITYEVQAFEKIKNLVVNIAGADGRIIQTLQSPTLTPLEAGHAQLEIVLPGRGYFVVTLQATTQDQRVVKTTTTAAVLGIPIDDSRRMQSRLGLQTTSGDKRLVRAANGRWDRRLMSLFNVKEEDVTRADATESVVIPPEKQAITKSYDWTAAFAFGLPNWLMGVTPDKSYKGFGNAFAPPKDWDKLDEVLDYYFKKYKNRIFDYLEVYNEPMAHWKGTREELVRFHHAVAKSVKKFRPNVKVLGPCLYSMRINELEQLANLGLFDKLDGIVMHAYVNNSTPEEKFLEGLKELTAFRDRPEYSHLPIFLTEFGWTTIPGSWMVAVDELTQAQFCARSLALCISENIDGVVYFCMEFRAPTDYDGSFSLIEPTGRPKPGYVAFSTISRQFADATPVTRLKLLPDVYMVVAKSPDHYVASIWSTGQNHTLAFPFPITSAVDMVGLPIALSNSGQLSISPSPIYIQMPDFPIDKLDPNQNVLQQQGQDLPASSDELFVFNSDWYTQGKLKIPSNAMPGQYLLLAKKGDRWQPQAITVQRPFEITSTKVDWPLKQESPTLRVMLTSQIDGDTLPVELSLKTAQSESTPVTYSLPPHTVREAKFDLRGIPFGQRLQGTLSAKSTCNGKPITLIDPMDVTVVPAFQTGKVKTWAQIPAMDFTNWNPFRTVDNADEAHPDCKAQLKCRYDANALELNIRVQDDEHKQDFAEKNPSRMWAQDSLQIAFDMDFDKPWVAAVGGDELLGGHRVFEFNIGKNTDRDAGVAFRHTSYSTKLPTNMIEPDIKVHVQRTGDITDYHIVIPWQILDAQEAPTPGQRIGFSLLVNDVDPIAKRTRHGVRLYAGIAESKDPKQYGPLWLR